MILNIPLKKQVCLFTIIAIVIAVIYQFTVSMSIFDKLRQDGEVQRLKNLGEVIIKLETRRFEDLSTMTQDYAIWEQTYNTIEEFNRTGKQKQISTATAIIEAEQLQLSNLVAMRLSNNANQTVKTTSIFDDTTHNQLMSLFSVQESLNPEKGIVILNGQIIDYVSMHVKQAENKLHSNGMLTFFRKQNQMVIDDIAEDFGVDIHQQIKVGDGKPFRVEIDDIITTKLQLHQWSGDTIIGNFSLHLKGRVMPVELSVAIPVNQTMRQKLSIILVIQSSILIIAALIWVSFMRRKVVLPISAVIEQVNTAKQVNASHLPKLENIQSGSHFEIDQLINDINHFSSQQQQQLERFKQLLDASQDLIIMVNTEQEIDSVNQKAQQWLTVDTKQLVGQPVDFCLQQASPFKYSIAYVINQVFTSKQPQTMPVKLKNNLANSPEIHGQIVVSFLMDEQQQPKVMLSIQPKYNLI
ncbi:PAS domain-containing protein [Shewanella sp. WXL01]|uniref:CHASE4 domain-containing protein n=1 Tax=Shewanella sp. WXL01 TaxID=2709721 RepID=UPI0014383866|nr:CHASE4 domain-containing protein [Shewanella sp. WXL01]NKF49880.1 PAS domain-containing protein [Shewanella sp. WXL01]